jgi:ATP-dependent Clp protease ATP-binding subunit ClpC
MEEGCLTDSTGRKVSFKNAVVIMTSNIGGGQKSDGLGFCPKGKEGQTAEELRQYFTPEFLGRLDRIVCFRDLTREALESVAEKYLKELEKRVRPMGVELQLPQELARSLAGRCKVTDGARQLRRMVQQDVEGPLAEFMLRSAGAGKVLGTLEEGKLTFSS